MAEFQGTATVRPVDTIPDDLDASPDRISELALGPEDCSAAVELGHGIIALTPDTLTMRVSADHEQNRV